MSIPASNALIVMRDRLIDECERLKAELECARGDLKTAGQIIERYENDAACFNYLAACKEWPDAISDLIDSGSPAAIRAAILEQIEKEFK